MKAKYSEETKVMLSHCDSTKRLSIPDTFAIFMDIATKHADTLKVSDRELGPKGLFWIVVRTKVHFCFRPKLMDNITVTTWPEAAGRVRCVRDYIIESGGKIAVVGKSEWAVIELESGKLQPTRDIYPADIEIADDICPIEPFSRVNADFSAAEVFAEYRVRSTDIDFGGHMNNAAYIRALASVFSSEQWNEMDISDIEITYKNQCYEGDNLQLRKLETTEGTVIGFLLPDGKVIATVKYYNSLKLS